MKKHSQPCSAEPQFFAGEVRLHNSTVAVSAQSSRYLAVLPTEVPLGSLQRILLRRRRLLLASLVALLELLARAAPA